jgi:hypothetical protein
LCGLAHIETQIAADTRCICPQHFAGTDFIDKLCAASVDHLKNCTGVVLVDLHGYDGSPAKSCLSVSTNGLRKLCATVCHSKDNTTLQAEICKAVHQAASMGTINIGGFPSFGPVVSELASLKKATCLSGKSGVAFHVTTPLASGLAIVEARLLSPCH